MQRCVAGPQGSDRRSAEELLPVRGCAVPSDEGWKRDIIGCLTAIETWLNTDSKKLYDEWNARVERIEKLVATIPGVQTEIYIPEDGNRYPTLRISWDQDAWGYSIKDA